MEDRLTLLLFRHFNSAYVFPEITTSSHQRWSSVWIDLVKSGHFLEQLIISIYQTTIAVGRHLSSRQTNVKIE